MKKLVIQNIEDKYGRFVGQMFGVWDTERKEMVLPHDWSRNARKRAEAFIAQGELPLTSPEREPCHRDQR